MNPAGVGLGKRLRTRVIAVLLSPRARAMKRRTAEVRRRLTHDPHVVTAYLGLDDPYSCLLAHYLEAFAAQYAVELDVVVVDAADGAYRPRPDLLADYARLDCTRIARELGVPFLDVGTEPPSRHRQALLDYLARLEGQAGCVAEILQTIRQYWRGDTADIARRADDRPQDGGGAEMLARNRERLLRLGHYNTAMLHYAGEWYWGVDRLAYLTDRLDTLGVRRETVAVSSRVPPGDAMQLRPPATPPPAARDLPPLELSYSFRSPYSYVALSRVYAVVDAFGLELEIRPVLPMLMRGMPVPKPKLLYIIHDAAREAERQGVPFGRVRDPLGPGVERLMAVFQLARAEKRGRDFVRITGEAIWSRGVDVSTDRGLRQVTDRVGLCWPDVVAAVNDDSWRAAAEQNRSRLLAAGTWGVPTLRFGDFTVWGQDRIWLLARHLEKRCAKGC